MNCGKSIESVFSGRRPQLVDRLQRTSDHRGTAADGMVFFHEIGWPYGRRDVCYQPELIPTEFQQPHRKGGVERGRSELVKGGYNEGHYNAEHEGGPRNGVLSAIEEFIKESATDYELITDMRQHGLGLMFRRAEPDSDRRAQFIRKRIFDSRYIDPVVHRWKSFVYRARNSTIASGLRCIRDVFRPSVDQ